MHIVTLLLFWSISWNHTKKGITGYLAAAFQKVNTLKNKKRSKSFNQHSIVVIIFFFDSWRLNLDRFKNNLAKLFFLNFSIIIIVAFAYETLDFMDFDFLGFIEFFARISEHGQNLLPFKVSIAVLIVFGEDLINKFIDLLFSQAHDVGSAK